MDVVILGRWWLEDGSRRPVDEIAKCVKVLTGGSACAKAVRLTSWRPRFPHSASDGPRQRAMWQGAAASGNLAS